MTRRTTIVLTIAGLLAGAAAFAGPPNPPAGPVAPTMKPLDQVEPRTPIAAATAPGNASNVFVISQPGSYYLTGDVVVGAGKNGITVTAPDVTIDLSGFMVKGQAGSLAGITTVEADRLVLRNGRISNLGGNGVYAGASAGSRLEGIIVTSCTGNGIVTGASSVADRCTAQNCNVNGFLLEMGSVVRDCVAAGNTRSGIKMQGRAQVLTSTASDNRESGVYSDGPANVVRECTSMNNVFDGISVAGTGAAVIGNVCTGNGFGPSPGGGITIHTTGTDNALVDNVVTGNNYGVHVVSTGNLIARTRAGGNSASFNIFNGNAVGPTLTAATMFNNANPDANYAY